MQVYSIPFFDAHIDLHTNMEAHIEDFQQKKHNLNVDLHMHLNVKSPHNRVHVRRHQDNDFGAGNFLLNLNSHGHSKLSVQNVKTIGTLAKSCPRARILFTGFGQHPTDGALGPNSYSINDALVPERLICGYLA